MALDTRDEATTRNGGGTRLDRALVEQRSIERAMGILMLRYRVGDDDALEMLQAWSTASHVTALELALAVLWHSGETGGAEPTMDAFRCLLNNLNSRDPDLIGTT